MNLDSKPFKKFYYTQDNLGNWKRGHFALLSMILFYLFCISSEASDFSWKGLLFLISIYGIFCFFHYRNYSKPVLIFYPSFLLVRGKKYHYTDIENYWVGSGFVYVARRCHVTESKQLLYIKIKNRSNPYQFDLQNKFSLEDSEEIIKYLEIHIPKSS